MLRSTALRYGLFVAFVFVSIMSLAALARAGSINIGSVNVGSSGSSGSNGSKGKDAPAVRQEFEVGKVRVGVPDEGKHQVTKLPNGDWVWPYGGKQVFSKEKRDVMAAHGIAQPASGCRGEWSYSFGSNGHCVVYVASHKAIPHLHVYGSAKSEKAVKLILGMVVVREVKAETKAEKVEDEKAVDQDAADPPVPTDCE